MADVVDVLQFARNCHHKTLLSLVLYVDLHCPHARPTFYHLSPLTPSNDLGENISDIVGGREHLSFGMASHGINNRCLRRWESSRFPRHGS
jgi:hypothetical protein